MKDKEFRKNKEHRERVQTNRYMADVNNGLNRQQVEEYTRNGWTNEPVDPPSKSVQEIIQSNVFTYFNLVFAVLAVLLIVVDGIIYIPFVKAYDASLLEEEKQKEALEALEEQVKEEEPETNEPLQLDKKINVLVLCVGAGTSAMFANAVKEGAKETGLPVDATASAYGNHYDILKNYDVVVLSPQVQAHLEEVKQDAKEGTKVIATKGAQYIQLTRDPKGAVEFIVEQEKEG